MSIYKVSTPTLKSIKRRDACYCGSRIQFKDCCGSLSENRRPPKDLFTFKQALSEKECDDIIQKIEARTIPRFNNDLIAKNNCSFVKENYLNSILSQACKKIVEPATGKKIGFFEQAKIFQYDNTTPIAQHADSEVYNSSTNCWERDKQRDLSIYICLSSRYEGGLINFSNYGYHFKGQKGDILIFPSDQRFMFSVEAVTSGECYVLSSWATWQLEGQPNLTLTSI